MSDKFENFYETIKENIINDFYTPNIKAEVILDMLITNEIAK